MDEPQRICSVDGCDLRANTPGASRGWCSKHYTRWRRHGDPCWTPPTVEERFWSHVDVRDPDACWPWTGATRYGHSRTPYGKTAYEGRARGAHSVAYELAYGPIPDGLQIDHVRARGCTSTLCCNPTHLEAVTSRENVLRGDTIVAANAAKTHCLNGHPLADDNLYQRGGRRHCRACHAARQRGYREAGRLRSC